MTQDNKPETGITLFKAETGLTTRDLVAHGKRIQDIAQQAMKEGVHFGRIPGVPKPTLFKPGAELLCVTFGLRPDFTETHRLDTSAVYEWPERRKRSGDIIPAGKCIGLTHYGYKCKVVHFATGRIIGEGEGSCSNWETKYRDLPWPDVDNTVKKMAQKRALVAAVLVATACSDTFTQDVEDMPHITDEAHASAPAQEAPRGLCPDHNKPFVERKGPSGAFWACGTKTGEKDGRATWCQRRPAEAPATKPEAQTGTVVSADKATPEQVAAIYALGHELGAKNDAETDRRTIVKMGVRPQDLTVPQASKLIDALKTAVADAQKRASAPVPEAAKGV